MTIRLKLLLAMLAFVLLTASSFKCIPEKKEGNELLNSVGKVKTILLIDRNEGNSLGYFAEWIHKMPKVKFAVVILSYKRNDRAEALIGLLKKEGVEVLPLAGLDRRHIHSCNRNGQELSQDIKDFDGVSFAHTGTSAAYTTDECLPFEQVDFPNNKHVNYYINGMTANDRKLLEKMLKDKFDIQTKFEGEANGSLSLDTKNVLLAGGNYINADGNVFIGKTYLTPFGGDEAKAKAALQSHYNFDPAKIYFVGNPDPTSPPTLYHLDLIFTCVKRNNKLYYFIADIPGNINPTVDGVVSYPGTVQDVLRKNKSDLEALLKTIYNGDTTKYTIVSVPAYMDTAGRFIYSPVNGIADAEGKYYFPYIDVRAEQGIDMLQISICRDSAMHKFEEVLGSQNVIEMNVSGSMVRSNSQSLHCTMDVISRE